MTTAAQSDPSSDTVDVLVLGGGSGGYAAALRSAQLGASVALVERDLLGGTCLHRGCIPTKAMLHAGEVADAVRHGKRVGVSAGEPQVDLGAVHAFRTGVVDRLYRGLSGLVSAAGVELVAGTGVLEPAEEGPPSVRVGDRRLRGRSLVLATGARTRMLPGVELSSRVVTSDGMLALAEVPRRAVVLGGGVIGVEMASALASFGSEVTIVEALDRLVAAEEPEISSALQRAFRKRGIAARTSARVERVDDPDDGDPVRVSLADGTVLAADLVVVAVGREPVTDEIGLAECGIATDGPHVDTDGRGGTSVANVYAVGDVVKGLQLAHRGFAHGIMVAERIAGLDPAPVLDQTVPRVTYCDPEIASVGLSEDRAREIHGDIATQTYNLAGNGRSQILGTSGLVKIIRASDGPVVGIHMIGSRMGEQAGEAELIVGWEAFPEEVGALLHAHPTQNEALGEAHLALAGTALHAHG